MRLIHFALLLAIPGYVMAADLIGSEVPPYPDNMEDTGGACVGGPPDTSDICDYSIGILQESQAGLRYLYAGKLVRRDNNGKSYWFVADVMPYPKHPEGFRISISTCRLKGVDDRTIFAVVKNTDEEWHKDIARAYRLDIRQQIFVPLEPEGIECQNEGWGV